jgi:flagellin
MADINRSPKPYAPTCSSLQNTATLMAKTQDRLATGNKVNSALDNPTNFFTACLAEFSRAGDLNHLMDSHGQRHPDASQAADNGLTVHHQERWNPCSRPCVRLARTSPSRPLRSTVGAGLDCCPEHQRSTGGAIGSNPGHHRPGHRCNVAGTPAVPGTPAVQRRCSSLPPPSPA